MLDTDSSDRCSPSLAEIVKPNSSFPTRLIGGDSRASQERAFCHRHRRPCVQQSTKMPASGRMEALLPETENKKIKTDFGRQGKEKVGAEI